MATVTKAKAKSGGGADPAKAARQAAEAVKRAAVALKQVSDVTRIQVVLLLADGEQHVGAICERFGQSQPSVSHHLSLLRHGRLVQVHRRGKFNFYSLTEAGERLAAVVRSLTLTAWPA